MTLSDRPPEPRALLVAAGSVTGHDHRRAQRDGQDGFATVATPEVAAAIVTDGCSSGRASEVGARLGAAWIAALIEEHLPGARTVEEARAAAQAIVDALVARLRGLDLGPPVASEMLLFGFLAAAVTRDVAIVFGVGDGLAHIDGAVTVIDPGPDNAPVYPAYALMGASITPRILFAGPAAGVHTLAIATDGVDEATLAALAADPRLDANPSLLRKRLVVLSDQGMFHDDATVAIVRRRAPS